MLLKSAIVILLIAMLLSLSSGLVYLLKDIDVPGSKRTAYALGIRVSIAITLLTLILYGVASGKLRNTAPWDQPSRSSATANQLPSAGN